MALNVLDDCTFAGPALTEPFVRYELEKELVRLGLLPRPTGEEARVFEESWASYRRGLRDLVSQGGSIRVRNHVLEPLVPRLGYESIEDAPDVETREGREAGGQLMLADGSRLRVWAASLDEDLDAPAKRGRAYRFSHVRIAERVLLASGERLGLLTNGTELRVLISDPARPDSQVIVKIDPNWKRSRDVPDSYRLLLALASPKGAEKLPEIVEKARLQQAHVTRELRRQAREAIEAFVQEVLDHPENRDRLAAAGDRERLAHDLWREGLVLIYRLLFILKLETSDDPARAFAFASTSLWRRTFSPSVALAPLVREVLDRGAETGRLLEDGLRHCFRLFVGGLKSTELNVQPLGGALFGETAMPLLSGLRWGERAVAKLLDRLLWTPRRRGSLARERVHYGPLDVEDLGRVYEALLELEPGITSEPMCRLRRQKLEVVVPIAQGVRYRPALAPVPEETTEPSEEVAEEACATAEDEDQAEVEEEETPARATKTKVEWIEEIPPGRFFLRVGLGRKSTGSYYTPHSFVRFLVQETLGPQVEKASPAADPNPAAILALKVLDPAMGSGHFLVEACRFLGEKLYEACRLCDEKYLAADRRAENAKSAADRAAPLAEAARWLHRVVELPDPDDELVRYLPSHSAEGVESGVSQKKAEALCRRLVAVHCLYGVDKNPLAVELAKLSLWIESHAEGLPLTFLDHRLLLGDSLTGPFFEHLLKYPGSQAPMDDLFTRGLAERLTQSLAQALRHVADLEASVGVTLSEVESKRAAKARLDRALAPFKMIAAAWSGGVMLGRDKCDDHGYADLVRHVAEKGDLPETIPPATRLPRMIARGLGADSVPSAREGLLALLESKACIPAFPFDLAFPEVFFPRGAISDRRGFDAVLGNPPWDKPHDEKKLFFGAYDLNLLETDKRSDWESASEELLQRPDVHKAWDEFRANNDAARHAVRSLLRAVEQATGAPSEGHADLYMGFLARSYSLSRHGGFVGFVLSGGFPKNAAARPLRQLFMHDLEPQAALHFNNTKRLFEDLPPIIELSLFCGSNQPWRTGHKARVGVNLDSFAHLQDSSLLHQLQKNQLASCQVGQLTFQSMIGPCPAPDAMGNLYDFIRAELGGVTQEINTSSNPSVLAVAEVLPQGADPRSDQFHPHLIAQGLIPVVGGRSIRQFDDFPIDIRGRWSPVPEHVLRVHDRQVAPALARSRYFRLAFRRKCGSPKSNERSAVACIVAPGFLCSDSLLVEIAPDGRASLKALVAVAVMNAFAVDALMRPKIQVMLGDSLLRDTPSPSLVPLAPLILSHATLRLSSNRRIFELLWREQVGDAWRERKPPFTWPVLEGDDARWEVRAAIDAVVAEAYGLSRDQYAHVLSTFSHRSYLGAPALCLAHFDELKSIGLDAFTRKHDPYWDIPLNENLPKPVIDIRILPGTVAAPEQGRRPVRPRRRITLPLEPELPLAADPEAKGYRPPSAIPPSGDPSRPIEPPPTGTEPLNEAIYARIRQLLAERGTITSSDAQAVTSLSAAEVRPYLQRLVEEGLAVVEGERRGTRYRAQHGSASSSGKDE